MYCICNEKACIIFISSFYLEMGKPDNVERKKILNKVLPRKYRNINNKCGTIYIITITTTNTANVIIWTKEIHLPLSFHPLRGYISLALNHVSDLHFAYSFFVVLRSTYTTSFVNYSVTYYKKNYLLEIGLPNKWNCNVSSYSIIKSFLSIYRQT